MTTTFDRTQRRLTLLVRAGEIFHQSLDVSATLNNVARLAVESFADICIFDLIDERSDRLFVTASAHHDPHREEALATVSTLLYVEEYGVHPVVQVSRTGEPFFLKHIDENVIREHAASRQHAQYMRTFGYRSKIVVPVTAQNHIYGALTFVRTDDSNEFEDDDLVFARELGRRAGLAVNNAKLFHREQHVAETLQRTFLPSGLPARDDIEITAYYRPGSSDANVGGDWYDAFETESGNIVLTIGDVTGKGIEAANTMVHVRQAIRTAALDWDDPAKFADICNRLLLTENEERLASAFFGVLNVKTRTLSYVSAGHAPPLLRISASRIERLRDPSQPLGAFRSANFERHEITCPPKSMLLLYTDGLIEASHDVLAGEAMLERVLTSQAFAHAVNPAEFVERAITAGSPRDDVAALVVSFGQTQRRWQFVAADARAAYAMRDKFFETLHCLGVPKTDVNACGLIYGELVGNAVRHAPGQLDVSLEIQNGDLILHVIDEGPGFNYLPRLPSNLWSETGRGLYLVSKLARNVEVERIPGSGSHISVTLPIPKIPSKQDSIF